MTEKKTLSEADYDFLLSAYYSNYETIKSNNALFESKITYVAAGLIVLSFVFIENTTVFASPCVITLFLIGVGGSAISLLLNLWSFFYGNRLMRKDAETAADLIKVVARLDLEKECDITRARSHKTIRKINNWNKCTLASLSAGMLSMLTFILKLILN